MNLPLKFVLDNYPTHQSLGCLFDAKGKRICRDISQEEANQLLAILDAAAYLAVSSTISLRHGGTAVVCQEYLESLMQAVRPCVDLPPKCIYVIAKYADDVTQWRDNQPNKYALPPTLYIKNVSELRGMKLTEQNLVLLSDWEERIDAELIRGLLERNRLDPKTITKE